MQVSSSADPALVVLHPMQSWLQQTKTWIFQQVRWLPPEVTAHVACHTTENLEQFPCEHLHVLAQRPPWRTRFEFWARHAHAHALRFPVLVAERCGAHVLHSHFGPDGWRNIGVARTAGLGHLVTFYGYDVTRIPRAPKWQRRYLRLFATVDRVLCEGPHMRQQLIQLGCPEHKVVVQHLGVDLTLIPFEPRSWLPGTPLRVLIAGSFREKKGIPDAILALGQLREARPDLDLKVTLIGDAGKAPDEQQEKQRILAALATTGLAERTELLGYQPYAALLEAGRRSHIFLSPSVHAADGDTEGGAPVTIIEMAASGMLVVSTTHCDIPNVLSGPARDLLAAEHDVPGLADRLLRLVAAPADWLALQELVRRDLELRFDARRQGQLLAQHYAEVAQLARRRVSAFSRLRRRLLR